MKRKLHLISLLILCVGMSSVSFAQTWDAPALKGSVPVSGTTYYVYNLGKKAFLNRGGNWRTQAIATAFPYANEAVINAAGSIVKWTAVNTTGTTWTLQYNIGGADENGKYLFAANASNGEVYTDNTNDNTWVLAVADASRNIYTLQVPATYGGYNTEQFLGVGSAAEGTSMGYANVVKYNIPSGNDYTKWIFVSQADYELYLAKVTLDRYMTYADMIGGIDLTSYINTYNADVTSNINTAATNLLTTLDPEDFIWSIYNPSFEDGFNHWTNSGFWTQGNDGLDPYRVGSVYAEAHTNSGWNDPHNLGTLSVTQKITDIPNGIYGLVLSAHAFQQAGSNPCHTNAFVTATTVTGSYTTEVSIRKDYFVDFIEVKDSTLTIGYKTSGQVACNWTGFDNFRLYLYAEMTYTEPILSVSEESFFFDESNTQKTFTVSGTNLTDNVTFSAPTGISFNPASVTAAEAQAVGGKTVTVTWNPSLLGTKKDGQITVSSTGATSQTISFITSKESDCAIFLAPTKNLITDPSFNNSEQPGWGNRCRTTEASYCGAYAGKVSGRRAGSLNRDIAWKPETAYIIRAYVNTNASGYVLGLGEAYVDGVQNNETYNVIPNTNSTWQLFENTFVTGASATTGLIWFNNYASDISGIGYIDNYELYEAWIVSFNTNGGSAVDPVYAVKGEKITAPAAPTKSGNTFKGWYKEAELNNAWNFETDVVNNNTTLYAKWDVGVGMNLPGDAVIKTEYFSLTGAQLESIDQSGLYIVKKIYESGKTEVLKQFIKYAN